MKIVQGIRNILDLTAATLLRMCVEKAEWINQWLDSGGVRRENLE
jgi:hypothetical protein